MTANPDFIVIEQKTTVPSEVITRRDDLDKDEAILNAAYYSEHKFEFPVDSEVSQRVSHSFNAFAEAADKTYSVIPGKIEGWKKTGATSLALDISENLQDVVTAYQKIVGLESAAKQRGETPHPKIVQVREGLQKLLPKLIAAEEIQKRMLIGEDVQLTDIPQTLDAASNVQRPDDINELSTASLQTELRAINTILGDANKITISGIGLTRKDIEKMSPPVQDIDAPTALPTQDERPPLGLGEELLKLGREKRERQRNTPQPTQPAQRNNRNQQEEPEKELPTPPTSLTQMVYPPSTQDVMAVIHEANEQKLPVITYGIAANRLNNMMKNLDVIESASRTSPSQSRSEERLNWSEAYRLVRSHQFDNLKGRYGVMTSAIRGTAVVVARSSMLPEDSLLPQLISGEVLPLRTIDARGRVLEDSIAGQYNRNERSFSVDSSLSERLKSIHEGRAATVRMETLETEFTEDRGAGMAIADRPDRPDEYVMHAYEYLQRGGKLPPRTTAVFDTLPDRISSNRPDILAVDIPANLQPAFDGFASGQVSEPQLAAAINSTNAQIVTGWNDDAALAFMLPDAPKLIEAAKTLRASGGRVLAVGLPTPDILKNRASNQLLEAQQEYISANLLREIGNNPTKEFLTVLKMDVLLPPSQTLGQPPKFPRQTQDLDCVLSDIGAHYSAIVRPIAPGRNEGQAKVLNYDKTGDRAITIEDVEALGNLSPNGAPGNGNGRNR